VNFAYGDDSVPSGDIGDNLVQIQKAGAFIVCLGLMIFITFL